MSPPRLTPAQWQAFITQRAAVYRRVIVMLDALNVERPADAHPPSKRHP